MYNSAVRAASSVRDKERTVESVMLDQLWLKQWAAEGNTQAGAGAVL